LMTRNLDVTVLDNLSNGTLRSLGTWLGNPRLKFAHVDLLDSEDVMRIGKGCETIFHLAANPEVRLGTVNPVVHYEQNVLATFNLLEAIRKIGDVRVFVFTSSSTVYGDALDVPTPEDYAPLEPVSIYGSSKLSCEALIVGYAHTYGFKAVIYRLANIVGPRSTHGVVYDFVRKLRMNPKELQVLGDGTQMKSYLFIDDCIRGMLVGFEKADARVEVFNIGSEDQIDVRTIANIVIEEMGLENVTLTFSSGPDGRGWIGDVKNMLLDTSKLKSRGWRAERNSEESIRLAVRNTLAS